MATKGKVRPKAVASAKRPATVKPTSFSATTVKPPINFNYPYIGSLINEEELIKLRNDRKTATVFISLLEESVDEFVVARSAQGGCVIANNKFAEFIPVTGLKLGQKLRLRS